MSKQVLVVVGKYSRPQMACQCKGIGPRALYTESLPLDLSTGWPFLEEPGCVTCVIAMAQGHLPCSTIYTHLQQIYKNLAPQILPTAMPKGRSRPSREREDCKWASYFSSTLWIFSSYKIPCTQRHFPASWILQEWHYTWITECHPSQGTILRPVQRGW